MKAQIIFGGIILGAALRCNALEAGDVMVVGYISDGTDSVAFVPWMELATGETITVTDARYEGGGSGADEDSGEGVDGGTYVQANSNLVWTNSTGSPIAPGTVIVVSEGSASLGTVSGNLRLTNNGEQFFLIQGSFNGSNNLIGDLLFGVDYEGSTAWAGGTNESVLPTALTSANAVDFNDTDNCQYSGQRTGAELETGYRTLVSNPSNWTALSASLDTSALNTTAFVATVIPPVVVPDELGQVSDGLLFYARRMNNKLPVLDEAWSLAQGAASTDADNLNGPCCVRLPSWLAAGDRVDPTAEYYLYFADHGGDYIRMAWAPTLEGPWTGYKMSNSLPLIQRGVLSLGSDAIISPGNQIEVNGHIASPQVFIDDVNQRFLMYYHGPTDQNGSDRGQSTLAAISPFGLNFNMPGADGGVAGYGTYPVILGESYFKVFEQAGDFYAFSNTGDIWKCPDPAAGCFRYTKSYPGQVSAGGVTVR